MSRRVDLQVTDNDTGRLPVNSVAPYRVRSDDIKCRIDLHYVFIELQIFHQQPYHIPTSLNKIKYHPPKNQSSKTMPPSQSTPASTLQTQKSTATSTHRSQVHSKNSQCCPGCAKGSQGYSSKDCTALVEAVKSFLPLGSQEWGMFWSGTTHMQPGTIVQCVRSIP